MPNGNSDMQAATVRDFFSRLNGEGICYAVLRNYELYPDFGHDIDLIVRWKDLSRLKVAAESCAKDHGWSTLTECDHWARSFSREHTIQILRFFSLDPLLYLQIDAFHSLLVLGLPLFDEDALLRDRFEDIRGFYRINEGVESFFRLMQIAKLSGQRSAAEKLKRYTERALLFWNRIQDPSLFAASVGFPDISPALAYLRSGNLALFKREMDRQKRAWLVERTSTHPFQTGRKLVSRCLDYAHNLWLRPCGFVVRAFAEDETQRDRFEQILRSFVENNIIATFTMSREFKQRQRVRARGGVIAEWTSLENADILVDRRTDGRDISSALLTLIIERHSAIFDQRKA